MRIGPVSRTEAMAMIEELSGSQILMGARGQKRFDIDAIADAIVHLSQLLLGFPANQGTRYQSPADFPRR